MEDLWILERKMCGCVVKDSVKDKSNSSMLSQNERTSSIFKLLFIYLIITVSTASATKLSPPHPVSIKIQNILSLVKF